MSPYLHYLHFISLLERARGCEIRIFEECTRLLCLPFFSSIRAGEIVCEMERFSSLRETLILTLTPVTKISADAAVEQTKNGSNPNALCNDPSLKHLDSNIVSLIESEVS